MNFERIFLEHHVDLNIDIGRLSSTVMSIVGFLTPAIKQLLYNKCWNFQYKVSAT